MEVSGESDVKFVVWDRRWTIIASWLPDAADVGAVVSADGAGNLARAMRGETVLFGPEVLRSDGTGFVPETELPVMAEIVPVRNEKGQAIATMLVRGIGMFDDFDSIFRQASETSGLDVYAVDADGLMISNSSLGGQAIPDSSRSACLLRPSDPGANPISRRYEVGVSSATAAHLRSQRGIFGSIECSVGRVSKLPRRACRWCLAMD